MSNVQGRKRVAFQKTVLAIGLFLQCLAYANSSVAGAELPTASVAKYHAETGYYTFKLGTYEITVISDGTVPQDLHVLLKGAPQKTVDGLLSQVHLRNPIEASINVFLINTGKKLILVDTGAGDFFGKGFGGKFSERLNKLGVKPEDISDILITHIHTDHTGGLVHKGKAVFPNANIYVGKADVDFFLDAKNQNGVNGYDKAYFQQAQTAMQPYVALGHVKPLSGAQKILDDFNAYPTPGHTPGHYCYRLESQGQSITFIGDSVHVEAVQFPHPDITITYDVDRPSAAKQRQAQFAQLAKSGSMIAAPHLPYPGIGYINAQKDGFTFIRAEFHDRDGL
ncbi:MBL fold metallo-hydrolase [Methylophilus sp. Leaf408]|uniref:MBL fold metallo-hydrolase n=1 Tax=Methylophilus sp. Leaf408 TaxID=2876561 RepID=UPI001E2A6EF3|nr:MBL fold metallo-hydrolase [Methylophilus sp. Leaf408]